MRRAEAKYLPEEILIQILVRLPVKSLLRFKSVRKSWHSLIIDPTFIQVHLKTSSKNTSYIIIIRYSDSRPHPKYSIHYDDESFRKYYAPQLPSSIVKQSLVVKGSCNGLVCLVNKSRTWLWNPALGKLKTLPIPQISYSDSDMCTNYVAFGFLPQVNDYKVVRILCEWFEPRKAEVYSTSTDSWRRIDVAPPSCYFIGGRSAVLNGAAYWVAKKETDDEWCYLLVRFEMGDGVFEEVRLPDAIAAGRRCPENIAVLEESLYLFIPSCGNGGWKNWNCYDVWTMEYGKMGCWTKQYVANFNNPLMCFNCMGKSGEQLQFNPGGHLESYNFETQTTKDLGIHGYLLLLYSCVESLIQLDGAQSIFPLENGNPSCELASRRKRKKKIVSRCSYLQGNQERVGFVGS
ncbi:F-box/kelch-repeat protein At3g23880-like [Cornus florida]|uniref:F-box/kelch-repeat protein At3g23880-like n=1 Tax=Cornus florida TaxID=4283 RepID=UPI002899F84C|nr:F-box/kelch-repeat protein At3g23880-like [Cornus florida]